MKILSVTQSLVNKLREGIIIGEFPAGGQLKETEISEHFGVSCPPLREAFRKLEYEKLVVGVPRKGTFVANMSEEDCLELFAVRQVVENAAIDVFAKSGMVDFPDLRKAVERGNKFQLPLKPGPQDIIRYYHVMAEFHRKLVELSNNRWLMHCYNSFTSSLARYQIMYLKIQGSHQASMDVHNEVLTFLSSSKYQEAREMLSCHIMQAAEYVVKSMRLMIPSQK